MNEVMTLEQVRDALRDTKQAQELVYGTLADELADAIDAHLAQAGDGGTGCKHCDEWRFDKCDCNDWPVEAVGGESREFVLRAMAANYSEAHSWDKLDTDACLRGADEIKALRAALAHPRPAVPEGYKLVKLTYEEKQWIESPVINLDFSKPLETENGEPVTWVCADVIQFRQARVCVDQQKGIVYSSPYTGLKIRNAAPAAPESGGG
jgi:hypothetical protein